VSAAPRRFGVSAGFGDVLAHVRQHGVLRFGQDSGANTLPVAEIRGPGDEFVDIAA